MNPYEPPQTMQPPRYAHARWVISGVLCGAGVTLLATGVIGSIISLIAYIVRSDDSFSLSKGPYQELLQFGCAGALALLLSYLTFEPFALSKRYGPPPTKD